MGDMANRPVRLRALNPVERYLDPPGEGDFAQEGDTRLLRRPRVAGFTEMVPDESASNIEMFLSGFSDLGYDD